MNQEQWANLGEEHIPYWLSLLVSDDSYDSFAACSALDERLFSPGSDSPEKFGDEKLILSNDLILRVIEELFLLISQKVLSETSKSGVASLVVTACRFSIHKEFIGEYYERSKQILQFVSSQRELLLPLLESDNPSVRKEVAEILALISGNA
jgi:hypothetical protein